MLTSLLHNLSCAISLGIKKLLRLTAGSGVSHTSRIDSTHPPPNNGETNQIYMKNVAIRPVCLLKFLFGSLLSLALVSALNAQEAPAESAQIIELKSLPPVLRDGCYLYLTKGANQALIHWKKYYAPARDQDDFSRAFRDKMRELDKYLGNIVKIEQINVRQLTTSLRSYYLLFGFEEGVIYARFDLYATEEDLQIIGYTIDSKMNNVIPSYFQIME